MNIPNATDTLLRRQAHLLNRIGKSDKDLGYDKAESAAISCVLMEIRKLKEENRVLKGK